MPPKKQHVRSLDHYAAHRCLCGHIQYQDDVPGGECRFDLCLCTDHRARGYREPAAPVRCPGHACDLGRTQEWIAGMAERRESGGPADQDPDLPPGHFWYPDGSYVAHAEAAAK